MTYKLEAEVSTDTGDFTVIFEYEINGEYRPAVMYPNDAASPEEFPDIEITETLLQLSSNQWLVVDHVVFDDWANDNEDKFFEGAE